MKPYFLLYVYLLIKLRMICAERFFLCMSYIQICIFFVCLGQKNFKTTQSCHLSLFFFCWLDIGFQFYHSGVYYNPKCNSQDLDHAMTLVGWGSQSQGGDYWVVKNQWGKDWGENGYILMARNKNNNCGIASSACYANV